jgi:hypothetical protein
MEEAQVPVEKGMRITGHRCLFYSLFVFMIFIKTLNLLTRSIWQGCQVVLKVQRCRLVSRSASVPRCHLW